MPTVPIWTDTAMQGDTELRERRLCWWNRRNGWRDWTYFWLLILPSQTSCFSESVLWSLILYGFVCAVLFAFIEVQTAHFWAMFLYQVVPCHQVPYSYFSVTLVYLKHSHWMCTPPPTPSNNNVWLQFNCAWKNHPSKEADWIIRMARIRWRGSFPSAETNKTIYLVNGNML